MQDNDIVVMLVSAKGKATGQATLRAVPKEQAMKVAGGAWAICWVVAILCLPIPIIHFIAPPILLLTGPALAFLIFKIYSGAVDMTQCSGKCPDCDAVIVLDSRAERWPTELVCAACQAFISINRA